MTVGVISTEKGLIEERCEKHDLRNRQQWQDQGAEPAAGGAFQCHDFRVVGRCPGHQKCKGIARRSGTVKQFGGERR